MTNINTETKGPKGVQIKESLIPGGSSGFTRGLAVVYGTDVYHAAVASVANSPCIASSRKMRSLHRSDLCDRARPNGWARLAQLFRPRR